MPTAALIYPHQLFRDHPALTGAEVAFLIEDPLFFRQYSFHKQKLMLHRATMKCYAADLSRPVRYIDARQLDVTGDVVRDLLKAGCKSARVVDPSDDWLRRRLTEACNRSGIALTVIDDPCFLTPRAEIESFVESKRRLSFTDFYIQQRRRLSLLIENGKPVGGKWSYDVDNRKKLPATRKPPAPRVPAENPFVREAREYVQRKFPNAPGDDAPFVYPTSPRDARAWLADFLEHRFAEFGTYEDAISTRETLLYHSLLSPLLNIGLLSPSEVVAGALQHADRVPMNSLEGFLRQVIGWREFMRLVYLTKGRQQRTRNFWGFTNDLPKSFYDGTTGVEPVDLVIQNVLRTGYCHHIERLMILGNFMLLCEVHPDAIYRWFMELFIDAYDWVMVPNVYGMSQHADGGLATTKPYISGSSYVLKMSDHKKGPWCPIWDSLYWRFIDRQAEFFAANPRMSMMVKMKDKLGDKLGEHHRVADRFLAQLHH